MKKKKEVERQKGELLLFFLASFAVEKYPV